MSPPDFVDLTTLQQPFSSLGAYRTTQYELSGKGEPERITGVRVSASVFPILGVPPAIGSLANGKAMATAPTSLPSM